MTFGSALETTTGASIRSPPSSSTPSPGTIRATGTPVATTAPSARAASQSRNETIPIPPTTYPHIPGSPPSRPEAWWKWIDAVPGSCGLALVPITPWPRYAIWIRSSSR